MGKLIDITGQSFGRWTVLCREGTKDREATWRCQCSCRGNESIRVVKGSELRSGKSRSCGCIRNENLSTKKTIHGMSDTRLYKMWKNIKTRCYDKNDKSFINYGGRGVQMCDSWKNSFESFAEWALSNGYSDALSIERVDVNGGYSPDNCTFITVPEQARNRRNTLLTVNGVTKTKGEWCKEYGINLRTLSSRLNKLGWSPEDAVLTRPRTKS